MGIEHQISLDTRTEGHLDNFRSYRMLYSFIRYISTLGYRKSNMICSSTFSGKVVIFSEQINLRGHILSLFKNLLFPLSII